METDGEIDAYSDKSSIHLPEETDASVIIKVKKCSIAGCRYVEKKSNNNMKHHYVTYHPEINYPESPFCVKDMASEEIELLNTDWLNSSVRKNKLKRNTLKNLSLIHI